MQNSKSKNENRVQELSKITRSLKIIAREFNIPIIALSQLSRNVENRLIKNQFYQIYEKVDLLNKMLI
jgi:replicative DNA helicase